MWTTIALPARVEIERHCRAVMPREGCGYVTVDAEGVERFVALPNRSLEQDRFWITRSDDRRIRRDLRKRGRAIAAFVHTHRSGLELSSADEEGQSSLSLPWVICALSLTGLQYRIYPPARLK